MSLDACRPLKIEAPGAEGGTQLDLGPTELNPLQDAVISAGVYLCGPSTASADKTVLLDRSGASLRLADQVTSHVLGELVSSTAGQVGSHQSLLDVIHFLPEGPGDGWASGSYQVLAMNGPLLASDTWYTDSSQSKKIVATAYTYSGPLCVQAKLTLYATDGVTLVRTVTDVFSYAGPSRTGSTRTWGTT